MSSPLLDARVRLSIELALTVGRADARQCQRQDSKARRLGMTGAEIDAARTGYSFDAITARAVALALAVRDGDPHRAWQRTRALEAGISREACRQIEELAFQLVKEPDHV